MDGVFAKLDLKEQTQILVLDAPESFESTPAALKKARIVRTIGAAGTIAFALAFVTRQAAVDRLSRALSARARADVLLWFAYPKGTSRRYACEFNRDSGWQVLRSAGFDSVRQVAIDADWSALRFRREQFIRR